MASSSSDEALELSPSEDETEEDGTSWRAEDDADDGTALDSRVAGAFEALNRAIARNNEVEAAHTAAVDQLSSEKAAGEVALASLSQKHARQMRKIERFRTQQKAANEVATKLASVSQSHAQALELLQKKELKFQSLMQGLLNL